MRLKEYEPARKWLEQIGTDAPPDVLPPAKALLAEVLMAEGNYPGAAKEWEVLRARRAWPRRCGSPPRTSSRCAR